jgi:DNA-directed RNA polymerase specialized sigma24 family protein
VHIDCCLRLRFHQRIGDFHRLVRCLDDRSRQIVDGRKIWRIQIEKMLTCLKRLSPEKQKLITALFFDNKSEHQVSRETGVPQRTIHDRKIKILAKLKRLMNE